MGKKIRRVVGILLLLTAVLITQLPVPEMSAASADDFQIKDNTLIKYTGTASTVSVPDTVKVIGEEAFANNLSINTVSCGNQVKEILHGAFANCTYLTKVEIPDTMESIDSAAFSGCENLSHLNFGKNIKKIGQGSFAGCNAVKTVVIDEKNPYLVFDKGALYNKDKTILYAYFGGDKATSFTMPDTVEKIYSYTFWGNQNLEQITVSNDLKEIPGYAFSNCKNLQTITIPYSVNSIDAKAFENCISLTDTTIPLSVSYIHSTAFDGCNKLNIIAEEGSVAYDFFQNFEKSDIEVTEEEDTKKIVVSSNSGSVSGNDTGGTLGEVYHNNLALKDASEDPSNVEYMPKKDPLSGLEDSAVIAKTIIVDGNAVLFLNRDVAINQGMVIKDDSIARGISDNSISQDNGEIIYDPQKGGYLPKYTMIDNKIASQAFYALQDMQEYTIPQEVKEIGDFSFARSNIGKVEIPDGTTKIGYGAFYCCDKLSEVSIPDSVEDIKAYAFENSLWMNNWKSNADGSDYLVVGNDILLAYKGSANSIEIPQGVKKIAPGCFAEHTEIQNVYLPDSLKVIGEDAFRGCTNLNLVTGGNYIEQIEDRAFMQCPLSTYTFPNTVKTIGLRAIDFTDTGKEDNTKAVIFSGNVLPQVSYGATSQRLQNEDYQKDTLYNVLYAVVPESVTEFDNTVLDDDKLGFSGMILSIEKDESGNETGNVIVKENHIFSEMVLDQIPKSIILRGKEYVIKDFENITLASLDETQDDEKTMEINVLYNNQPTQEIKATFSENEKVGTLYITENDVVKQKMEEAYGELFGENIPDMKGYDIVLKDQTETMTITKFGKARLSITMKLTSNMNGETCHVICMDADGQLEEVDTKVDKEAGTFTFQASHLSNYAVYTTGSETTTLNVKNGQLIHNLKKDESPNTGDYSIPPKYVLAVAVMCCGLLCLFYKKKKNVTI